MDENVGQRWERRYREGQVHWEASPNPALVEVLGDLDPLPGRALDLGCGHGGDVFWLAEHGWRVLGVDISRTAVERVSAQIERRGLADRAEARCLDMSSEVPEGPFDLVTSSYVHGMGEFDPYEAFRRAAGHLVLGGLLVVLDHATRASWMPHRLGDDLVAPSAHELWLRLALGEEFRAELLSVREREAKGPDGQVEVLGDAVVVARRVARAGD